MFVSEGQRPRSKFETRLYRYPGRFCGYRSKPMPTTRRTLLILIACSLAMTPLPGLAQQVIATVNVGAGPIGAAVDQGTNQIYVINNIDGTTMDIDGATNTVKY